MREQSVYLDRVSDRVHGTPACGETDGTTLRIESALGRGYEPCDDCLGLETPE